VTARPLGDYQVLSFDCYGTLIDWETGIWEALRPLRDRNPGTGLDRGSALERFAELESAHERDNPALRYPEILARVHRDLADALGLGTDDGLDEAFGSSVPAWPAFPDSAGALAILGGRYGLVILSNVHREGFAASSRRLGMPFDAVYTAEDIGSYKPDARNFEHMVDHLRTDLGVEPAQVLHVAQSLYHDHVPAQAIGLATAWIDRQRLSQGGNWGATARIDDPPTTDFTFFSMAELASAAVSSAGS
jgi:2-haloacid dehalogenase